MGNTSYSVSNRTFRAATLSYATKSMDQIFTQNIERKIHESMNPKNVTFRESRDSEIHPNTVPIQLYLDVTGSMKKIPHQMIKDGLPKLIGSLIQSGINDVALMFGAIGDHECDRFPLQISQFESGDAELDMWLTRTYLEGGGGGNAGESYLLAWYFAGNHVLTDSWIKRKKKGYVFTIGDEPNLKNLPLSAIKELMGDSAIGQATYTQQQLLEKAQETNHVFHIQVSHIGVPEAYTRVIDSWRELLGQNLIVITDHEKVAETIANLVLSIENNSEIIKSNIKPLDKQTEEILL